MTRTTKGFLMGCVSIVVSFCLVVLVWASATGQSFTDVIRGWFEPQKETTQPPVMDGDGKDISSGTHELPRTMTFTAASKDGSLSTTVTATIEPANTTNQLIDWSLRWENAESEWATGKAVTDYVTITPTADGSLTVEVKCLQAFGERVQLKATSRDMPSVFKECPVNFLKRITNVRTTLTDVHGVQQPFTLNNDESFSLVVPLDFGKDVAHTAAFNQDYGLGTKVEEITSVKFSYELTAELKAAILESLADPSFIYFGGLELKSDDGLPMVLADADFFQQTMSVGSEYARDVMPAILAKVEKHVIFHVTLTSEHLEYSSVFFAKIDTSRFFEKMTNIELDKSEIVF